MTLAISINGESHTAVVRLKDRADPPKAEVDYLQVTRGIAGAFWVHFTSDRGSTRRPWRMRAKALQLSGSWSEYIVSITGGLHGPIGSTSDQNERTFDDVTCCRSTKIRETAQHPKHGL